MRTLRTIAELRGVLEGPRARAQAAREGAGASSKRRTVGLVPTMGAFHDGHLSLMRRARAECDLVVVSVFVNPTQFNDPSDLETYPRDERRDAALAEAAGIDFLFAPSIRELYPEGFATRVAVSGLGEMLEGAHRGPGHFAGVATVVVKLLNIVSPDLAYFGQKDAQQTVLIKRVVRDLDIPVRIRVCPTVRAPDGLALSSRNHRLSPGERVRAGALYRSLKAAEQAIAARERDPAAVAAIARHELALDAIEPDYFELVDPETFAPAERLRKDVLAVVAASIGTTRLIDNHLIHVPAAPRQANPDPATALAPLPS